MKLVRESLYSFERGKKDISSLGVGRRQLIEKWLNEMEIKDYTINDDFTIDVDEYVDLRNKDLEKLPDYIQFNKVGRFSCSNNKLISLRGCPKIAIDGFACSTNCLTTLEYAPEYVGRLFSCHMQRNGIRFTEDEVRKYCKVDGKIYVE